MYFTSRVFVEQIGVTFTFPIRCMCGGFALHWKHESTLINAYQRKWHLKID